MFFFKNLNEGRASYDIRSVNGSDLGWICTRLEIESNRKLLGLNSSPKLIREVHPELDLYLIRKTDSWMRGLKTVASVLWPLCHDLTQLNVNPYVLMGKGLDDDMMMIHSSLFPPILFLLNIWISMNIIEIWEIRLGKGRCKLLLSGVNIYSLVQLIYIPINSNIMTKHL